MSTIKGQVTMISCETHGWIKPGTFLGKKIHFENTPASHGGGLGFAVLSIWLF